MNRNQLIKYLDDNLTRCSCINKITEESGDLLAETFGVDKVYAAYASNYIRIYDSALNTVYIKYNLLVAIVKYNNTDYFRFSMPDSFTDNISPKEFQINRIISFEVRLEERDIKIIEDGDVVTFLRLEQKRSESNPFFWMDRFFVKKSERKSYESRQVFIDEEKI